MNYENVEHVILYIIIIMRFEGFLSQGLDKISYFFVKEHPTSDENVLKQVEYILYYSDLGKIRFPFFEKSNPIFTNLFISTLENFLVQ